MQEYFGIKKAYVICLVIMSLSVYSLTDFSKESMLEIAVKSEGIQIR